MLDELTDECNLGSRLVHLPHIERFIVVDALVDLVWFEALRGATIHDIGHFYRSKCTV